MRVYPVCLGLFLFLIGADVFLFSFRNAMMSNANPGTERNTTIFILLVAHAMVIIFQFATVFTCVCSTFYAEGLVTHRIIRLLQFYAPFFLCHLFFVLFNTLYETIMIKSPYDNRPWSTPTYAILMILHLLVFVSYFLSGVFVYGVLSEKTLYPPFSTRVHGSAKSTATLRKRSRRLAEDSEGSHRPYTSLRKSPIFGSGTAFPQSDTTANRISFSTAPVTTSDPGATYRSTRKSEGSHRKTADDTETNADISSLLQSIPPLEMPKPIDHPETVQLLAQGAPPSIAPSPIRP